MFLDDAQILAPSPMDADYALVQEALEDAEQAANLKNTIEEKTAFSRPDSEDEMSDAQISMISESLAPSAMEHTERAKSPSHLFHTDVTGTLPMHLDKSETTSDTANPKPESYEGLPLFPLAPVSGIQFGNIQIEARSPQQASLRHQYGTLFVPDFEPAVHMPDGPSSFHGTTRTPSPANDSEAEYDQIQMRDMVMYFSNEEGVEMESPK